jgi:hypothetical protein
MVTITGEGKWSNSSAHVPLLKMTVLLSLVEVVLIPAPAVVYRTSGASGEMISQPEITLKIQISH